MSLLRVGLLGLGPVGLVYLDVLRSGTPFELVAMADTHVERLRKACRDSDVTPFEDYRSLIVAQTRNPIDALFVTLPPHQTANLLPLAAERGVAVFHHAPFARTADEAQRLTHTFEQAHCPLVISRLWSAQLPGSSTQDLFDLTGRLFAAHACVQSRDTVANWRGDAQRAGGGALRYAGYDAVDAMVSLLGLPESVFAECGTAKMPSSPKGYDTEDVAMVTLRFGHGEIGSLTVWRGGKKDNWELTLIGTEGTATWRRHHEDDKTRGADFSRAVRYCVEVFGRELSMPDAPGQMASAARDHLPTLAVVDAAYLSAKTGSPEVPAQFMQEAAR